LRGSRRFWNFGAERRVVGRQQIRSCIGGSMTATDMIQFDVIGGIAASLISASIVVLWFQAVTGR